MQVLLLLFFLSLVFMHFLFFALKAYFTIVPNVRLEKRRYIMVLGAQGKMTMVAKIVGLGFEM